MVAHLSLGLNQPPATPPTNPALRANSSHCGAMMWAAEKCFTTVPLTYTLPFTEAERQRALRCVLQKTCFIGRSQLANPIRNPEICSGIQRCLEKPAIR